jgi:hypothetical protein
MKKIRWTKLNRLIDATDGTCLPDAGKLQYIGTAPLKNNRVTD